MNLFYHYLFPCAWWSFAAYWTVSALWVRKTKVMESPLTRIAHLLVGTLALLMLAFRGYLPRPMNWQLWPQNKFTFWLGAAVTLAGLGFAVWARIHLGRYWSGAITLKEGHRLIRSGPYQFVRNPIYTGILTGLAGTAIALGQVSGLIALAILWAVYSWKIQREQRLLAGEFGEEYAAYCRDVPALVPYKLPSRS
ncbi:MAG TPA: isoprenylcysteine carboxylmethyltransferase family protein [Verrucomicrobiae bacterium]|jgi:protein-S-isoprenylcysteine O-methyltransferase Ste14|nr:isoprenylcysteine carboxylmethyltransferase family protein [Verrucomicrobiae bacterium]